MLLIPGSRITRVYFEQRVGHEQLHYGHDVERVIEERITHGLLDRETLISEGKLSQGWVADPKSIEFRRLDSELDLTVRFIATCNYHPVEDVVLFDSMEELRGLPSGSTFATPIMYSQFDYREAYVLTPDRSLALLEGGRMNRERRAYTPRSLKALYVPDSPMSYKELEEIEFTSEGVPVRVMLKEKMMADHDVSITMLDGVL